MGLRRVSCSSPYISHAPDPPTLYRQEAFMETYFTTQRDNVFRNVEVLIYVFDVESREVDKDMHYYQSCLEAILQNSPDAKVFCLIHKMDLLPEDQRQMVRHIPFSCFHFFYPNVPPPQIYEKREAELQKRSLPLECKCFKTSIWDETLYKASHVTIVCCHVTVTIRRGPR